MSNLKYVNDDEEYNALTKTAGNDLVVVDFYTTWCGPCRQMEPVIESMVMKHPRVLFLKVDADKCFETAMSHDVKGVPLFVIYMNRVVVERIQGAHPQLLDQKVAYYEQEYRKLNPSLPHVPEERSSQLSDVISSIGKIREVTPYLDEKGCRCINDLSPTPFDGFANGKKLTSGKGSGKIVLVYSFKQRLMLHSFKIKAHAETGPKVLRFFVNHPKVLDFSVGSQLAPAQEVTLSPADLKGERSIELRAGSFSLVSNLQIFVTEGMTKGHPRLDIDHITLYGAPVEMTSKSNVSVGFSGPPVTKATTSGPGATSTGAESVENSTERPKHADILKAIEYLTSSGVDVEGITDLVDNINNPHHHDHHDHHHHRQETEASTARKKFDRDQKPRNILEARRSTNKPATGSGQSKKSKGKKNK